MFPLCAKCAEEQHQGLCKHTDKERQLTGTWASIELIKALDKGYTLVERHEAWDFLQTCQYNKATGEKGLFSEYVDSWLKVKTEASGYPSWVKTEEDEARYLADFFEQEGIELDPEKIIKNPGLRAVAKLCLNSLWGEYAAMTTKDQDLHVQIRFTR